MVQIFVELYRMEKNSLDLASTLGLQVSPKTSLLFLSFLHLGLNPACT